VLPSWQKPTSDGLIMIRKIIKADNNCLFNAIGYAVKNKSEENAMELR